MERLAFAVVALAVVAFAYRTGYRAGRRSCRRGW